ncbi:unnamed protein product [Adineta ricciae]|uniref:MMS19 nucleotide excision repair protein n=1 Tax=Adineta ricciae TaxID=249248 RepID=A0A813N8T2_ADIRI|nr:unnamed protein product [Adineta ricciae]
MDCRTLIERYGNDRDEIAVTQLSELLKTNQLSLVDFIVDIGDYLQSTELSKRTVALVLIGNVLKSLPNTFLQSHEIHHLLIFIIAKMADHHILAQPAADLFSVLAKQSALTDDDCIMMIKSIFSYMYVQSFPQASRHKVFVVLLHFLFTRLDVVRQLGSDFVCNFIQSMDGERDPRNLVLCFQCLQYMTKYLDIEPYKEELFEVVACYFPMEYKPKTASNETEETITHEQLALALRNVLTSSGKFAQYCIPMLIEKLESDIPSARLAAMDVFINSIEEYDARDISSHLVQLWNLFSKQALCAENQETETNALRAITALMQLVGKSVQNDDTEISTKKLVNRAIRECENYLKELDLKLVWPATKVLQAVARANSTCSSLIWSSVLPLLTKQFESLEQVNHRQTVLDMIIYFLQSTSLRTVVKLPPGLADELWILISTQFQSFQSHCLSLIHSLLQLNTTPGQVLEDDLTKFILQGNIPDQLRIKLSAVMRMLASSVIFDRICTNLLTNLINSWTVTKTNPSNEVLESCLDLCHNSERCQERLERFFFPSQQFIQYLPSLFKYLPPSYILTNLFSPLFDLLLSSIDNDQHAKIFCAKCGAIADESCKPFVEDQYRKNLLDDSLWQSEKSMNVLLMIYFIGNLKRKTYQNELEMVFKQIHEKLTEKIFNQKFDETNTIYCCFLANLINKLSSNDEIMEQGQTIIKQCETIPDQLHIHLWTIVVKAFVLSRPSTFEQYIPKLMSWINERNGIGDIACQSLKVLTNFDEQSLLLSSQADCIVHPMVKQIVFMNIISQMKPFLMNNDLLPNQMNILIDLLNNIPKSIIQDEIIPLLPILVRALTSSNESIWSASLQSISDLIKSEPNSIIDHIDTLLPRLTTLATYQKDMTIRITSLKCLNYLTALPIHKIQPYRRHIIHVLRKCVDDHKRLVRRQAIETQMSWCLLNA